MSSMIYHVFFWSCMKCFINSRQTIICKGFVHPDKKINFGSVELFWSTCAIYNLGNKDAPVRI